MVKMYKPLYEIVEEYKLSDKIILTDFDAWINHPNFNFIYNKMWIAKSQGLDHGPMGVYPEENIYPIIFKPIINLYGMSRGVKKIHNDEEYDENIKDGLFWEKFLIGEHNCVDIVIYKGEIIFCSSLISISNCDVNCGTFLYHHTKKDYTLPEHIELWIKHYFNNYSGCLNLEIINGNIIEAHLRLNGDFQMYDTNFVIQLHNLLEYGDLSIRNYEVKDIFLIPIFVNKNFDEMIMNDKTKNIIKSLCDTFGANSIYFDDINSLHQSEHLSRIIIFDINNLQSGFNLKRNISQLINI